MGNLGKGPDLRLVHVVSDGDAAHVRMDVETVVQRHMPANDLPKWGEPDYPAYAGLFNDVTEAMLRSFEGTNHFVPLSGRQRLTNELWRAGYRGRGFPE